MQRSETKWKRQQHRNVNNFSILPLLVCHFSYIWHVSSLLKAAYCKRNSLRTLMPSIPPAPQLLVSDAHHTTHASFTESGRGASTFPCSIDLYGNYHFSFIQFFRALHTPRSFPTFPLFSTKRELEHVYSVVKVLLKMNVVSLYVIFQSVSLTHDRRSEPTHCKIS